MTKDEESTHKNTDGTELLNLSASIFPKLERPKKSQGNSS
eukprot:CAMPEP_0116870794 /NCGR_PEP_ID=MMETSP0463-20121206/870_1 /TAXON_ID=181622 /ORGANISM="Strombidinopsis sp, Strain SopsisLIS2011" /LENGTH=39 /DNA_ID= /DNA_START= /DNA_END= /DNA_ORIENTATION=